jgi:hypothetical protein
MNDSIYRKFALKWKFIPPQVANLLNKESCERMGLKSGANMPCILGQKSHTHYAYKVPAKSM